MAKRAEITYNAGVSYRIGLYRFPKGVTVNVHDEDVIQRAETTCGFSVYRTEDPDAPVIGKKKRTPAPRRKKSAKRKKPGPRKKILRARR